MIWKVRVKDQYYNCERIHPLQQEWVGILVRQLIKHNEVEQICIFGSSVTKWCHNKSDVDIFVRLKKKMRRKDLLDYGEINFPFDLVTNFDTDESFIEQIYKEGVVVYDKGNPA